MRRVTLTIAGSDCSSGAGLQADLKTFTAHGLYGLTAVTCVVSEVPGKVNAIQPVRPEIVADQVRLLLERFPVAAVKTGMLFSKEIIAAVAEILAAQPTGRRPALVVDPVMVATSGDPLLKKSAIAAYERLLFPLATVITPNLDEASVLLGKKITTEAHLMPAADSLHVRYGCAVLLKGGHLKGATALDVLRDTAGFKTYAAPFIPNVSTHGTGCTYSAAIAAALAQGKLLRDAVKAAKRFVTRAIADSLTWGKGAERLQALNHRLPGASV